MNEEKPLIEFTTDSKVIINGIEITSKNEWDRVLKHLKEYYKNFNKISSLLNYEQDKRIKLENIIKEAINYIKEESWFCYKDNEEVIDRTPINKLLEILGDNDENI